MNLELRGMAAVVIGGSSGIGADLAVVLAEEGCDVAVAYRTSSHGANRLRPQCGIRGGERGLPRST